MGKIWNTIKQGASNLWNEIKKSPKDAWNKLKSGYNWLRENVPMFKEGVDYLKEKVPFAGLVEKGLTKVDEFLNSGKGDIIANKLLLRNEQPITGIKPAVMSPSSMMNTAIQNLNNQNRFLQATPQG